MRYIFDYNDQVMLYIFKLGGLEASQEELTSWLTREEDQNHVLCKDQNLAHFLNGLIINNRGAKDDEPPQAETRLNNNMIFRKLRIALNLQSEEIIDMLKLIDFKMSKHELSALFRQPSHKNYRICQDQLLRNVLNAMEKHYRSGKSEPEA